jgi:hypothetical protein
MVVIRPFFHLIYAAGRGSESGAQLLLLQDKFEIQERSLIAYLIAKKFQ